MSGEPSLVVLAAVLLAAALSMLVYAAKGRGKDQDATGRGTQFLMGAGNFLVHWFLWALSPLDRLAAALGLTPDFFNWAGLLFGALSGDRKSVV